MEEARKKLEKSAEDLEQLTSRTSIALSEMRLQFEAITEIQKDERETMYKVHQEEIEKVRKHYGKIVCGLLMTIILLIVGVIGGVIYVFHNYDFQSYSLTQDMNIGGAGENTINDGLHFNLGE